MRRPVKIMLITAVLVVAVVAGIFAYGSLRRQAYPLDYRQLITEGAAANGLDPALVFAVIKCESGFDPAAVSSIGAMGLMQLTPETYDWARGKTADHAGDAGLTDPATNIKYGTLVLGSHLKEFGGVVSAVAAYHAGRGKLQEWLDQYGVTGADFTVEQIPYADTRAYVRRVLAALATYRQMYPELEARS